MLTTRRSQCENCDAAGQVCTVRLTLTTRVPGVCQRCAVRRIRCRGAVWEGMTALPPSSPSELGGGVDDLSRLEQSVSALNQANADLRAEVSGLRSSLEETGARFSALLEFVSLSFGFSSVPTDESS